MADPRNRWSPSLWAIALLLPATGAQASDIGFFETRTETDWVATGVGGLRGSGNSSVALSGVTGPVDRAYLYWHGPTNSADPSANATVSFDGNDVTGTQIGFSDDNLWGFANSQAYRADVTAHVTGDGDYALANFRKDANIEINGASLVVFFDDGDDTNDRDVVLFDGNDANFANAFDALGWNVELQGIDYASGDASVLLGVSDGQNFFNGDDGSLLINGVGFSPPDLFEGTSLPGGTGPTGNGNLWDLVTLDLTSLLSPGLNDLLLTLSTPGNGDALGVIHLAIDLPAGAAPPVPEPAAGALLASGVAAWAVLRRRQAPEPRDARRA